MKEAFLRFLRVLAAVLVFLVSCAALVWPLWALATGSRRLFTILVAFCLALLLIIRSKLRARAASRPKSRESGDDQAVLRT